MNCAVHTDTPATAYCRTCGKALCENCKRDVMGAIYCEPCIAVRLQSNQPQPQTTPAAPVPVVPGTPSPGVAMLLGFIPGVGAMYNGQFMKGFIHVVVFVMLIVATSNVSGYFGILIGFWVAYMAFDAYKTAEAKRLGLPLPDPLGLDHLFGLQEGRNAPPPSAVRVAGFSEPAAYGAVPQEQQMQASPSDHAPTGAIVLIGLGVILLLGNVVNFSLHRYWPLILICVGLWLAYKRLAPGAGEAR
jgi:TM2 domain-containing membrane protein YozV